LGSITALDGEWKAAAPPDRSAHRATCRYRCGWTATVIHSDAALATGYTKALILLGREAGELDAAPAQSAAVIV